MMLAILIISFFPMLREFSPKKHPSFSEKIQAIL